MTHELKYLLSIVKFLIFGDVLKHEYVVMSLGIELPVSQCVVPGSLPVPELSYTIYWFPTKGADRDTALVIFLVVLRWNVSSLVFWFGLL